MDIMDMVQQINALWLSVTEINLQLREHLSMLGNEAITSVKLSQKLHHGAMNVK